MESHFSDHRIGVLWVRGFGWRIIGFPISVVGRDVWLFPRSRFLIWNLRDFIEATPVVGDFIGVGPGVNWLAIPIFDMSQNPMEEELRTTISLDSVSTLLHYLQLMFSVDSKPLGYPLKCLGMNCFDVDIRHRDKSFSGIPTCS